MEIWDAYDRNRNRLAETLVRGEKIPHNRYHLVGEVLVRHSDGTFLIVQRAPTKETDPLKFEASAGGSCLQGESAQDGALRELFEETGILKVLSITSINLSSDSNAHYENFLVVTDCDKNNLTLQTSEAISYQWLDLQSFKKFIQSDLTITAAINRIQSFLNTL